MPDNKIIEGYIDLYLNSCAIHDVLCKEIVFTKLVDCLSEDELVELIHKGEELS